MFFSARGNRDKHRQKGISTSRKAKTGLRIEQLEERRLMHADPIDHADDGGIHPADVVAVSPTAVLPDLIPWVDEAKGFLHGWTVRENEIRLTTAMANIGEGALEIRGGEIIGDNIQEVQQRIYEPDGSFNDRLAGTFTYHPEHKHIHFDGFAQFNLREVLPDGGVGEVVAGGLKTSFCIIDIENYDSDVPAKYLTCKQVQGLSPGWADLYDKGLPGQQIDITNIQNGSYWLEMIVDPDNHIVESDESNNVERLLINLNREDAPTNADTFEPNDTFAAASILAPPEDHLYENLSIHQSGNNDYYRITASATGKLAVSIDFQHSQGDLELGLYNANQKKLGDSKTAKNTEKVTIDVKAGDIIYIRVWGYNNKTNPNYSMFVDQAEADDADSGDVFEDNDTFATAATLPAVDHVYEDLSVLRPNDNDYYSIVPTESGSLAVNLAFLNSQGNLELEIYNAAQTRVASSASTADGEQVRIPVTAGQAYYIRVLGKGTATNINYSLSVDMIEAGESTAYYLSTTANGTLASTDGSPSLTFTDADILKLIVMGNGLYHYELHLDGSDVGLDATAEDIDAFAFRPDGSILISTTGAYSVPAAGGGTLTGGREDVLLFTPTTLGDSTSGEWSLYFDGSSVGLTTKDENIDAIAELSDGRLLISTTGAVKVPGVSAQDEDLLAFDPTSLGTATSGTWSLYFDGSNVALKANDAEDVNGLFVDESGGLPTLYMTTVGNFSVAGASGANDDSFAFHPTSLGSTTAGSFGPGLALDGSLYGLSSFALDGIQFSSPAASTLLARSVAFESVYGPVSSLAAIADEPEPVKEPKKVSPSSISETPSGALLLTAQTSKPAKKKPTEPDCGCSSGNAKPANTTAAKWLKILSKKSR
ncbi:MAG: lysyl oxidase family protein [Pirellulales bacterium]